jgi:predicted lipoprotein with Yx(FWY)xxD motif
MKARAMFSIAVTLALPLMSVSQGNKTGKSTSISGWVVDSSCAYTKGLDKPISMACAKACAKNGSPLVILRDDGAIFLPIDRKTPSSSQNARLLPFAGEHVKVSGTEYAHGDSHGIVIASVTADRQ